MDNIKDLLEKYLLEALNNKSILLYLFDTDPENLAGLVIYVECERNITASIKKFLEK